MLLLTQAVRRFGDYSAFERSVVVAVFLLLGVAMNTLGHVLSIAWFRAWWQIVPCYLGYVLPLALMLRDITHNDGVGAAWRFAVVAFIPLELVGYATGTSVVAPNNWLGAVLGTHNFTLAMVLVVTPLPFVGNQLVDLLLRPRTPQAPVP